MTALDVPAVFPATLPGEFGLESFLAQFADRDTRLKVALQDLVTRRTTAFWAERGALNLHLPITTHSISSPMGLGSDSLPVQIDLFGVPTYLADSMQFMLEYGSRLAERGAWYLMPSFRGEQADSRHLNQFFHSEAEIPGGLDDVMAVSEAYVRSLTAAVLEELGPELERRLGDLDHLHAMVDAPAFPRLTLDEADELFGGDPEFIADDPAGFRVLTHAGERRLMEIVSPFVWVTHFDHLSVPFYQAYGDADCRTALNADLLFGIGEVVGGGERHVTGDDARAALAHHDVPEADYEWYLRMKDVAPLRTAGFGLGIERWLMWVLRSDDIRDMALLPRYNGVRMVP